MSFMPKDGCRWKIAWFGNISYPDKRRSHLQPAISVVLSRVEEQYIPNTTPEVQIRSVWVPVGLLPLFRVGDTWIDGKLASQDDSVRHQFRNIQIDPGHVSKAKSGSKIEGLGFILPWRKHRWHQGHTQSHCLIVHINERTRLVIPSVEMIRFYFGSSSSLLTALFTPPLTKARLCTEGHYSELSGRLKMKLSLSMSGFSASDIGRIYLSRDAWLAASEIGLSMLQSNQRLGLLYPRTSFPFTGTTDLDVVGEWLQDEPNGDRLFLVHSIQSCSHPFPFKTLIYVSPPRPINVNSYRGLTSQGAHSPPSAFASEVRVPMNVEYADPSRRYASRKLHSYHDVKFPDLISKSVFRALDAGPTIREKITSHYRKSKLTTFAVGNPTGTSAKIGPLELEITNQKPSSGLIPDFLKEHIAHLNSIDNLSVDLLSQSHNDNWTIAINAMQQDSRDIDARLLITKGKLSSPRRACVLNISKHGKSLGILVLLEASSTQGYFYPSYSANDEGMAKALEKAALAYLRKKGSNAWRVINSLLEKFH